MVDYLEDDGKGMNLTFEVRDGILNHTSKGSAATLEGHVVAWSDRIAYINHDIDDAIRGGIIKTSDIPHAYVKIFGATNSKRINTMILDIIHNSFLKPVVSPSPEIKENINGLRQFMFDNVYLSGEAKKEEHKAVRMIKYLYSHYYEHPDLIPKYITSLDSTLEQKVCDYISTMSDRYAVAAFEEIAVPKNWTKI
jgi:dGTPase